jgi:thymidylate kinase
LYDSFTVYQARLIEQFDEMAGEFGFVTVDATRPVQVVFEDIRDIIKKHFESE